MDPPGFVVKSRESLAVKNTKSAEDAMLTALSARAYCTNAPLSPAMPSSIYTDFDSPCAPRKLPLIFIFPLVLPSIAPSFHILFSEDGAGSAETKVNPPGYAARKDISENGASDWFWYSTAISTSLPETACPGAWMISAIGVAATV